MGAGIAQVAASAGHEVLLYGVRPEAAATALREMRESLKKLVAREKMSFQASEALLAKITPIYAISDATRSRLVVEAIREDIAVKQELFARLEQTIAHDAILASN